jgi:hypothetical protein
MVSILRASLNKKRNKYETPANVRDYELIQAGFFLSTKQKSWPVDNGIRLDNILSYFPATFEYSEEHFI